MGSKGFVKPSRAVATQLNIWNCQLDTRCHMESLDDTSHSHKATESQWSTSFWQGHLRKIYPIYNTSVTFLGSSSNLWMAPVFPAPKVKCRSARFANMGDLLSPTAWRLFWDSKVVALSRCEVWHMWKPNLMESWLIECFIIQWITFWWTWGRAYALPFSVTQRPSTARLCLRWEQNKPTTPNPPT